MSANELIKQVKALPPRERRKVLSAMLALEEDGKDQPVQKAKRVKWPNLESRARRIFDNRVQPNLVLLEREEEAF